MSKRIAFPFFLVQTSQYLTTSVGAVLFLLSSLALIIACHGYPTKQCLSDTPGLRKPASMTTYFGATLYLCKDSNTWGFEQRPFVGP